MVQVRSIVCARKFITPVRSRRIRSCACQEGSYAREAKRCVLRKLPPPDGSLDPLSMRVRSRSMVGGRSWGRQGQTRRGAVAPETVLLNHNRRRPEDPGYDVLATSTGEMCC